MFSKKDGLYRIAFSAEDKVKESYNKRRIPLPGILLTNEQFRGIASLTTQFPFLCYNNLE